MLLNTEIAVAQLYQAEFPFWKISQFIFVERIPL